MNRGLGAALFVAAGALVFLGVGFASGAPASSPKNDAGEIGVGADREKLRPDALGAADLEMVRRVVQRNRGQIRRCMERPLMRGHWS